MPNLIKGYLTDAKMTIDKLHKAINTSENDLIAELAHSLDGSSRSIGAKKLSKVSDRVFKAAKKQDSEEIQHNFESLKQVFEETGLELQNYLKSQDSIKLKNRD